MRSKILIIGGIILLVIIGIGLYFLFFAAKPTSIGTQAGQTGTLPSTGNQSSGNTPSGVASSTVPQLAQNFGPISDNAVLDYFVNPGNIVTAIEPNGEVISVADGQVTTLSSLAIQNIISASFSYDGSEILVNFGDAQNPQTSVFNVATEAWTPMSAGLLSPAWSPSDYRIAYYTNSTNGTEVFATMDVSKPKTAPVALIALHAQDLSVAWADKNQVVLYTKPSAYVPGSEWLFDLQKKTLTPIAVGTPGLETIWSGQTPGLTTPEGLVFSSNASGLGGALTLVDTSGNTLQSLNFSTLPSKCVFTSQASAPTAASSTPAQTTSTPYLYCGVPRDQNLFSFSHLPDDYDQMALFTSDNIYQINLQSGAINTVFDDPSQNPDTSDVKFANNTVFFINRYDQKLYAAEL